MADVMAFRLPREFTPAVMRLSGFEKNTTQIIPQNQQNYNASTPAQFFLPQAIIDFRSLVLYFSVVLSGTQGAAGVAEVQQITTMAGANASNVPSMTNATAITLPHVPVGSAAIINRAVPGDRDNASASNISPFTSAGGGASVNYTAVGGSAFSDLNVPALPPAGQAGTGNFSDSMTIPSFTNATAGVLVTIANSGVPTSPNAADTFYLSFKDAIAGPFIYGTSTYAAVTNALMALSTWPAGYVITQINAVDPLTATAFTFSAAGVFSIKIDTTATSKGPLGAMIKYIPGGVNVAALNNTFTAWTATGTPATAGQVALPRNIESLIDRYEFVVGGQNIHTGSVQYNSLFTDFLNQNTSSEFLAQRSVMQNAGNVQYFPQTAGVFGAYTSNFTTQKFCISSWLGFLGCKSILDLRKMPQCIIRIYFAQPTVLITQGAMTGVGYSITGSSSGGSASGVYMDCDVINMPESYDQLIDMKMASPEGLEVPYLNWYSTEQSNPAANASIVDFRFSFETQCLTDLVAIIRSSAYTTQASLDIVTGNSTFFKYQSRNLNNYVWNVFGKNYPQYFIPQEYAHELNLKSFGKLSHVDCGTLYSSLSQFLNGYYSARQSFEHVGPEMNFQSGMNTRGQTSQMIFKPQGSTAQSDGAGYSIVVFCIATSILRLFPDRFDYIV